MGKGLYTYNSIDKIEFCDSSEEDTDINYDCIEAILYKPVVGKFDYEITEDGLIVEKKKPGTSESEFTLPDSADYNEDLLYTDEGFEDFFKIFYENFLNFFITIDFDIVLFYGFITMLCVFFYLIYDLIYGISVFTHYYNKRQA